jgi:hypothetical protein
MDSNGAEPHGGPPEVPMDQEGEVSSKGDVISSLQLRFFLPQMATVLDAADLPHLYLVQLLTVLQRRDALATLLRMKFQPHFRWLLSFFVCSFSQYGHTGHIERT